MIGNANSNVNLKTKTLHVFIDMPEPRPNEYGGKYGQGVIVRKYNPGSEMTIRVELTASHMG